MSTGIHKNKNLVNYKLKNEFSRDIARPRPSYAPTEYTHLTTGEILLRKIRFRHPIEI